MRPPFDSVTCCRFPGVKRQRQKPRPFTYPAQSRLYIPQSLLCRVPPHFSYALRLTKAKTYRTKDHSPKPNAKKNLQAFKKKTCLDARGYRSRRFHV